MEKYKGSCHCQAVTYEVTGDFTTGMRCNCSHCQRKGFLLGFVEEENFKLLSGFDNVTTYQFNKKHIDHIFCKTCGVQSFAIGTDAKGNKAVMINLNCLENFDPNILKITEYDGKNI